MADSKLDTLYNNVPFLAKYVPVPGESSNTCCTTICESVENGDNGSKSEMIEDPQTCLMNDGLVNGLTYKYENDYDNVYRPNFLNQFNGEYQNGDGVLEYHVNQGMNFFPNDLDEYSKANLDDVSTVGNSENDVNFNLNTEPQYEPSEDYNVNNSAFIPEGYQTQEAGNNYIGYNPGYNGYNSNDYFPNEQGLKYQMVNMSNFPNADVPIDQSQLEMGFDPTASGYEANMNSSSENIGQNQMVGNYNNYNENMFDYANFNARNSISGVKYQRTDNRWIARWTTAEGKRACKSFSVNIYGFNQAKMLAIQARQKGVALSGRSFCNRERQHAMKSGVGIIGIRFDKTQARWVSSYYEGGKRKFRYFTVKDYGYEQAKRNAILWKSCNDERIVKRMKDGYGLNYLLPERMNSNVMYPNVGPAEEYMAGLRRDEKYPSEYPDPAKMGRYRTDYSNGSNYTNVSCATLNENYPEIKNFRNGHFNGKDEYDGSSSEYQENYNYGGTGDIQYNTGTANQEVQESMGDYENNLAWNNNGLRQYLNQCQNDPEYGDMIKRAYAEDLTTTTVGSDNVDLKSYDSMDKEMNDMEQGETNQEGANFAEGTDSGRSKAIYDGKNCRWVRT